MGGLALRGVLAAAILAASTASAAPAPAEGADPIPGALWDAEGYEDRVLGIRVGRLPAPWKAREWDGNWAGPVAAAVSFAHPSGALLEIHAFDPVGGDAGASAFAACAALGLSPPRPGSLRESEVVGEPAVVFEATGDPEDRERPYHAFVTLIVKDGVCYAVAAFTHGREAASDAARPLLERFAFLPTGDFRRSRPPFDVEGNGWRVRDGAVEHAFVGVRASLGPGWRLAPESTVPETLAIPSLHLRNSFLGVSVRMRALTFEGSSRGIAEAAADGLVDLEYAPAAKKVTLSCAVGDGKAAFQWRPARRRITDQGFRQFVLSGTLQGDGRVLLVEFLHPRAPDPRVPAAIRGFLRRMRVLGAEERSALVAAVAAQEDTQAFVGRDEFVRKGVYTSTAHRIVWRKPSAAWAFIPRGAIGEPGEVIAALQSSSDATCARVLFFEGAVAENKWQLHEAAVAALRESIPGTIASKPYPSTLGSRDGLRTDLRAKVVGIALRFSVFTSNPAARKVYALIAVAPEGPAAAEAIESTMKGLRFQVSEIPGPRRTPKGWLDPAYGFRVDAPAPAVRSEAQAASFLDGGGTLVEVATAEERLVVGAREWPLGEPDLEGAVLPRVLALLDPAGAKAGRFAGGADAEGTLSGLPARVRSWPGSPAVRVAWMRAAGTLYVVGAASAAAEEPTALSWFRLVD
jgi:hypothetical protein